MTKLSPKQEKRPRDQWLMDLAIYGNAFERVYPDGRREYVDPCTVLRIDIPAEVGENAGLEEGNTSSATGGR